MTPQPRPLALLMSIAGLGSSLAGAAEARSHDTASPAPVAVEWGLMPQGAAAWPANADAWQQWLAIPPAWDQPVNADAPADAVRAPRPARLVAVFPAPAPAETAAEPEVDIDLSASFDIDLGYLPPASPAQIASVDIEIDLPMTASSTPVLDIDLSAGPFTACDQPDELWADDMPSSVVVGTEVDRVLHSLHSLISQQAGDASPLIDLSVPNEVVFVATHEQKVLKTLEAFLQRPLRDAVQAETATPSTQAEPKPTPKPKPKPKPRWASADDQVALDDTRLDTVRGGFQPPGGVMLAFGIERAVYINGNLVTTSTLEVIASPGGASAAPSVNAGVGNLTLVQNGPGNSFSAGAVSPANLGTVIQNTLNDQRIGHVVSISATVNSLQATRAQNFESALRGALVDSLRR